jgi:hypothetical protein
LSRNCVARNPHRSPLPLFRVPVPAYNNCS